jgi:hypothetical protein
MPMQPVRGRFYLDLYIDSGNHLLYESKYHTNMPGQEHFQNSLGSSDESLKRFIEPLKGGGK